MNQKRRYRYAVDEVLAGFLSLGLTLIAIAQLTTPPSIGSPVCQLLASFSVPISDAGTLEVALVGVSNALSASLALRDIESMDVKWADDDPIPVKRRLARTAKTLVGCVLLSAAYAVLLPTALPGCPSGIAALLAIVLVTLQIPYYQLLVARFSAQLNISLGISRNDDKIEETDKE